VDRVEHKHGLGGEHLLHERVVLGVVADHHSDAAERCLEEADLDMDRAMVSLCRNSLCGRQ
jgi:hypothetical protein